MRMGIVSERRHRQRVQRIRRRLLIAAMVALLAGAGTSVCIELMQYLLMTGVTDVDDVLLNALGALLGWSLARLMLAIFPCFCYNKTE